MNVVGIHGCAGITGPAVVIDVLRAFTVAAWAFERGARRIHLVDDVGEALRLKDELDLVAINDGVPDGKFDLMNSPDHVAAADLAGRDVVQRTAAGTVGAVAARHAASLFCTGMVCAAATARAVTALDTDEVTLVVTAAPGQDDDDVACAEYITALLVEGHADPRPFVERVSRSPMAVALRQYVRDGNPGVGPRDVELALEVDRFDFAMRATDQPSGLVLADRTSATAACGSSKGVVNLAGTWTGRARILDAPGMVDVEIGADDVPEVSITLHPIGLANHPVSDVVVDGDAISGRLGTIGDVEIRPAGEGLTIHWARGTETLDVGLHRKDGDDPGDGPYPYVDAVVATRQGETIRDDYFCGTTADDLHTQQSCTKSVTALVFGTAVDRGEIELDAPVWKYLTNRPDSRWVREKYDATVHHLLCMSVGLEWNEEVHYTDPRNDNTRMNASGDWVGYVVDRPLQSNFPSGRFEYQSGLSILVGAVLQVATGKVVDELARERLFGPLGIDHFQWTKDGDGNPHTGGGLILRPRDMVKLGQLVLDGGQGIVSKEWVDLATSRQSHHAQSDTWYGYKWFLGNLPVGDRTYEVVAAGGYGGQSLMVIRELDLVIQSNAHDWFGDGALGKIAVDVASSVVPTR